MANGMKPRTAFTILIIVLLLLIALCTSIRKKEPKKTGANDIQIFLTV